MTGPTVVVQRSQPATPGRRHGASVTGSGSGTAGGSGSHEGGGTGQGEGAAKGGPTTAPAGTPNGVAPAPQTAGEEAGVLATLLAGSTVSAQALDFYRIPLFLLPVYQAAAFQYDVPWQILAAINEVETDYGTDLSVSSAGRARLDAVHARHLAAVWRGRHRRRLRRPLQPRRRDLRRRALPARRRRLPPPARRDLLLQPLPGIRRIGAAARPPDRQLPELGDRHAHRPRRRARADRRRPSGPKGGGRARSPGRGHGRERGAAGEGSTGAGAGAPGGSSNATAGAVPAGLPPTPASGRGAGGQ